MPHQEKVWECFQVYGRDSCWEYPYQCYHHHLGYLTPNLEGHYIPLTCFSKAHGFIVYCSDEFLNLVQARNHALKTPRKSQLYTTFVSYELEWTQHYYHLMKLSGPEQNFVQVKRDWSHLER